MASRQTGGGSGPLLAGLGVLGGAYVALVAAMLAADVAYVVGGGSTVWSGLAAPEIRHSLVLSLVTCTLAAVFSLLVGVSLGYLLARKEFPGKAAVEILADVPVILPPLVIGLSLLILFNRVGAGGESVEGWLNRAGIEVTYAVPAVVVAQFTAAAALAVRVMRVCFAQMSPRAEAVAQTLGCSPAGAFFRVALPQARSGMLAAFTLAWARSLGEFGPVYVFAGIMRGRTEVLSTTVFLELTAGRIETAVAVSVFMIVVAVVVLVLVRRLNAATEGAA